MDEVLQGVQHARIHHVEAEDARLREDEGGAEVTDQAELFENAPLVRLGADVRVRIGDGPKELPERAARRIDIKLNFQNPARRKLWGRLVSAMRTLFRVDLPADKREDMRDTWARDAARKVGRYAGFHAEYRDVYRAVKAVVYGSAEAKPDDADKPRIKRAVGAAMRLAREDEYVYACSREDGWLVAPRGCLPWMLRDLKGAIYNDQRTEGAAYDYKWRGPNLRPYQAEAVGFQHHRDGITVLPCGAGKTLTALAGIAKVGRRAVVLVPTKAVRNEWTTECWKCLGVAPGQVGDGRFAPEQHVTVAINATAVNLAPEKFEALFGAAGVLVVDECHHVAADKLRALVERVPAKLRWGLTATPFREDGLGQVMQWVLGPIVVESSQRELADAGHLVLPEVRKVESGWECPKDIDPAERYNDMVTALVGDKERNSLVLEVARRATAEHVRVLVLTSRTWHARHLAEELNPGKAFVATACTSDMPKRAQRDAVDVFREGDAKILCAVNIADEGLNVPALDAVVIAGPVKAKAKSIQRLGRLMRPLEGKAPVLYDVVDERVEQLKRQWWARRRAYKKVLGG
jgi:superfamily II DNA or RNA helicase